MLKFLVFCLTSLLFWACGSRDRDMVAIAEGCFAMGALENDPLASPIERPRRQQCVKKFLLDPTEVSQKSFSEVMGTNPSAHGACASCPVENVRWAEADEYCRRVKKRLPTEAEWEYAARAGTTTIYYWGNEFNGNYAWNSINSNGSTHPVRTCLPNAWGIYDMSGNVWEWVADLAGTEHTKGEVARVIRGGAFESHPYLHRSSARAWLHPDTRNPAVGFRCAK